MFYNPSVLKVVVVHTITYSRMQCLRQIFIALEKGKLCEYYQKDRPPVLRSV